MHEYGTVRTYILVASVLVFCCSRRLRPRGVDVDVVSRRVEV